jgi:hypothetical protein
MFARSAISNAVRLLTALAVMLSALSGLRAAPMFHQSGAVQRIEAAADTFLAADDDLSQSHSHDDDLNGGSRPGHPHEHKDHSHVVLGLPDLLTSWLPPQGKSLHCQEGCRAPSHLPFPPERPPCGFSVA